jgi:hypothetical protein
MCIIHVCVILVTLSLQLLYPDRFHSPSGNDSLCELQPSIQFNRWPGIYADQWFSFHVVVISDQSELVLLNNDHFSLFH